MELNDYLNEFSADWHLEGRARATVVSYCRFVREFVAHCDGEPTLGDAKCWLALSPSAETARYRARALRAFGKWSSANDGVLDPVCRSTCCEANTRFSARHLVANSTGVR